jgi:glycosyltransferase involved in cell wall biosynthesis
MMTEYTPNILLNGRFLTRQMTGVDRVAAELSVALSDALSERERGGLRLALPAGGVPDGISGSDAAERLLALPKLENLFGRGYVWEQASLLAAAPDDWLVNLCNMGPVLRRKQVTMIHDAQIYTQPQAYSRAFRNVYRTLLPRLGTRSAVVLTVSEYSRRELEQFGVVPPGKATVVRNGIDHIHRIAADETTLDRLKIKKGGYFLALGSMAPHKNIPMLAEVARSLGPDAPPLVIAGGGNPKVFKDAGIYESEKVRVLGRVTDGELKALYQGAFALVFPSKTEGFGLPPLEAMANSCPTIVTTGGAVPEVCGDASIYAAPDDPRAWRNAMEALVANPSKRDALIHAGQKRAQEFTWKRAAQVTLEAMEEAEAAFS